MIYLTTGANGAGKTLLTLKDVRAQQLKENRPVYYHGFEIEPAKAAEFGWQEFDPKKWQDLPDGSICIMDECQNEFPVRRSGSEVPEYINAIAQFRRKRGFDFWLICPHPSLIDLFIRRLIDKPSWHRHLKRAFGADVVSVLQFSSPDMRCEEPGAGSRGEVTMRPYPKEVYGWYKSASLHTAKRKIPRAVYVLGAAAVAVPAMLYYAITGVYGNVTKGEALSTPAQTAAPPVTAASAASRPDAALIKITADEYLALRKARLQDFPHTAPVFDGVTAPVVAPYPAACVHMAKICKCYSQQGTLLATSGEVCLQIVKHGFFIEWKQEPREDEARGKMLVRGVERKPEPLPRVAQDARESHKPPVNEWQQALAFRNSQVRSMNDR